MGSPSLRHTTHLLLHSPNEKHRFSAWLNRAIAALIIANATAVALETVPSLFQGHERSFRAFDAVSTILFLIEYMARIWCSVEQHKFAHPVWGRVRWAMRPIALLDLIAIAAYLAPVDLRFFRLARLLRLFRVLHMERMAKTYERLKISIAARKEILLVSGVLMFMALFSSAALLYICEHESQPTVFSSIPATMWWSVVTLTTVGYGDIYPITIAGKICAGFTAVFGVGVFALPAAVLTGAVIEADRISKVCPHCGKNLHQDAHHHS